MRRVALALSILFGLFTASIVMATSSQAVPGINNGFRYGDDSQAHHPMLTQVGGQLAMTSGSAADGHSLTLYNGTVVALTLDAINQSQIVKPARFLGSIVVPAAIATDHGMTTDASIDARTPEGQQILTEIADAGDAAAVANAQIGVINNNTGNGRATPSAHSLYVAAIGNLGPVDDADLQRSIDAARSYWVTQSNGAIISFDQVGPITRYESKVATTNNGCGIGKPSAAWNEARRQFPDVDFTKAGNHLMVVVPESCNSSFGAGVGTVGSSINSGGRVIVTGGSLLTAVATHEFGHNFSLQHANAERCANSSCVRDEYGDAYSVMGAAVPGKTWTTPTLGAAYREQLHIADASDDPFVDASGSVHLNASGSAAGVRSVRVIDTATDIQYEIAYRSGADGDAGTYYASSPTSGSYSFAPGIVITRVEPDDSLTLITRSAGELFQTSYAVGDQIDLGDLHITVNTFSPAAGAELGIRIGAVDPTTDQPTAQPRVISSTTSTSTTSTSTTSVSTSTAATPPSKKATTTTAPTTPATSTPAPTTAASTVKAVAVGNIANVHGSQLASTGVPVGTLVGFGIALMIAGAAVTVFARKGRRSWAE